MSLRDDESRVNQRGICFNDDSPLTSTYVGLNLQLKEADATPLLNQLSFAIEIPRKRSNGQANERTSGFVPSSDARVFQTRDRGTCKQRYADGSRRFPSPGGAGCTSLDEETKVR